MKVELANDFGFCEQLPPKSISHSVTAYLAYLKLGLNGEAIKEIFINDNIFSYDRQANTIIVPCIFTDENICEIKINYDNEEITYKLTCDKSVALDPKTFISLADFYRKTLECLGSYGRFDIDEVIVGIECGDIILLRMIEPLTGIDNKSLLDDIEQTIPFALNICSNPRRHLKVEDEVLDIDLVKRISPIALQHLASHSEHWKARTITGLIPSRMLAQVFEDDINIYENIFFRMVIEEVVRHLNKVYKRVDTAIQQREQLIDWNAYGNQFNDYRRGEIILKILPTYEYNVEDNKLKEFKDLCFRLEQLERKVSNIRSTSFYQSINKNAILQSPIQLTNIIKMDLNYNKIYELWNKLQIAKEDPKKLGLTGSTIDNIYYYYLLFVQLVLIFGLELMGLKNDPNSYIDISEDGPSKIDAKFYNDYFDIRCYTDTGNNFCRINVDISERYVARLKYPKIYDLEDKLKPFDNVCELDPNDRSYILFKRKLTLEEKKSISAIFRKSDNMVDVNKKKTRSYVEQIDMEWRQFIEAANIHLHEPRTFSIHIYPILSSLGEDEVDLKRNTEMLLNSSIKNLDNSCNVFVLPTDIYKFKDSEDVGLVNRVINYGASYNVEDAVKWGNYRVGILPISQTEISSVLRFIKLISIHLNRLFIEWDYAKKACPLCHSTDIINIDDYTWKCNNNSCGIIWGKTRCSAGCGEYFTWIKPSKIKISKSDIEGRTSLQIILKKESMFDRLTITDFDLIDEGYGEIKYVPKCPKCGCSSALTKVAKSKG